MGKKFQIEVELENAEHIGGGVERMLHLEVQKALTMAQVTINKVEVVEKPQRGATKRAAPGSPSGAPRGRKPVNRPRIEDWIRKNVVAGPAGMASGNGGVGKDGKPLGERPANRIIIQELSTEVGLNVPAVEKVMRELGVEGYVERGYANGSPYYDLVKPLEDEGKVGIRGREDEDEEEDDEEEDDEDELND